MDEARRRKVAAEVRAEAARQQLTGEQLADRTGIGYRAVLRKLDAKVDFTVGELQAVADALGVPPSKFLGDQVGAA